MEQSITVNYPKKLAFNLKMQENEFAHEMKKLAIIKLFEIGRISSGIASKVLQLNRIDFLEMLNNYKVSYLSNNSKEELIKDLQNA